MKEPIIFNRFENTKSVLGLNVTEKGTITHPAGYFGNSAYAQTTNDSLQFSGAKILDNYDAYTWEQWCYFDYALVSGVPGDATQHYLISMQTTGGATVEWMFLLVNSAGGTFRFYNNVGGTPQDVALSMSTVNWSASTWLHFAFVLDKAGINGGSDTVRIYIDNVMIHNSTTAYTNNPADVNIFGVGQFVDSAAGSGPMKCRNDNIKLYDYAKTDFSDRFDERGGLNDQSMVL